MKSNCPARLLLFLPLFFFVSQPVAANTLKITSHPSSATVEIDGVKVGTTPYEGKLPGGYFHRTHTVFGSRLERPMRLRISKEGYIAKEIVMTDGPMHWVAATGVYHGEYWLLKSDHFDVELLRIPRMLTGVVVAASAGNSRIEMRPELPTEEIVAKAEPAVVLLRATDGHGTGFFITQTGVIATNAHVARDEETLRAVLPTGRELIANVIYVDPDLDIALVKVEGGGFPSLPLADLSTVRQGQNVVAIGNPGGGMPFTITKGVVSAVGPIEGDHGTWIQTDAAINHGNSGGPLLNTFGEVVGINTLIERGSEKDVQGIAFALSASDPMEVVHRFYPAVSGVNAGAQGVEGIGAVTLTSDPDGADVYVDGKFVGNAPAMLKLAAGQHAVLLKSEGRADWQRSFEILKDSQLTLKAQFPAK